MRLMNQHHERSLAWDNGKDAFSYLTCSDGLETEHFAALGLLNEVKHQSIKESHEVFTVGRKLVVWNGGHDARDSMMAETDSSTHRELAHFQ